MESKFNMKKAQCYLCDTNSFQLVFEKDRNDECLSNYACENCGFVMVLPRPSFDVHEKLYYQGEFSSKALVGEKL
jgi:hypothetical protein